MRGLFILTVAAIGGLLASCADAVQPAVAPERVPPLGFSAMPFPPDNQPTPDRIKLGKRLFFDPILSADHSVSCASCHRPEYAFSDASIVSSGVEGRKGVRNTPSIVNAGYQPYFLREGGVPTLEMQVLVPIQEHAEFDMNILDVATRLQQNDSYVELSKRAYDRVPDPFVITRAIAAYERTLVSSNSRYDQFIRFGDPSVLSDQERRGMSLFLDRSNACASCHTTPYFTSFEFANNGLYKSYADQGRFRLTGLDSDRGVFKIPSLRNIAVTAPYMHDGSVYSLERVVKHYNNGGSGHPNQDPRIKPLGLSEAQQADLVAFLYSLTDEDFIHSPALRK